MPIPQDAVLLRIFFGEDDKHERLPLYEAIVLKAREMQLGGATVLRGPGASPARGARRVNAVLAAVRGMTVHAVAEGTAGGHLVPVLYEVADDRDLPGEALAGDGRMSWRLRARHRAVEVDAPVSRAADADIAALLAACVSARDRLIVMLLARAGLRRGEAAGLRRSDVHLLADSRLLGCGVPRAHLHVVRREDNPNGAGVPGGPHYGPGTLSAFLMLLDPKARGIVGLDARGNVIAPDIYLPATHDGDMDTALMTQAVFDMIRLFGRDRGLKILFGPGGPSHPHLNPDRLADIRRYVTGPSPVHGIYFNRLIVNHFGGTAALSEDEGGVDPATLILRGTANVAVVDASLLPVPVPAHPVGTIMAVADRAGELLAGRWA